MSSKKIAIALVAVLAVVAGVVLLYPDGDVQYSIQYELNGGEQNSLNPSEYTQGQTTQLYDAYYPDGEMAFVSWYLDSDLTQPVEITLKNLYSHEHYSAPVTAIGLDREIIDRDIPLIHGSWKLCQDPPPPGFSLTAQFLLFSRGEKGGKHQILPQKRIYHAVPVIVHPKQLWMVQHDRSYHRLGLTDGAEQTRQWAL